MKTRRHRCLPSPRRRPRWAWLVAVWLLVAGTAAAAPAGHERPERFGVPQPAAVELEVRLRGTADRVAIRPLQLAMRLLDRKVEAPAATVLQLDGLSFRKRRSDRARVAIRARLRAVQKGDAPALRLDLGAVGDLHVEVRAGGLLLASANIGQDEPRTLELALPVASLWRLPPVPRRRYERLALGFYYPWYGTPEGPTGRWRHWNPKRPRHDATDRPALGWYDSQAQAVIEQHAIWAREAGLDGLVFSWWSHVDPPDELLARWLDAAARHGLRLTVYIEDCRDVAGLRGDVRALIGRFGRHRAWLRHGGKPVVFIYGRVVDKLKGAGVAAALGDLGLHVNAMGLDTDLLAAVDGLHVYFHARHYERYVGGLDILRRAAALWDIPVVATVMPGYDDRVIRTPGFVLPRGDGSRWRHDWSLARGADWVLLTSFNEWHEGSEIEPSVEYGRTWLDETAAQIRRWKATP